jgi:site-specific DNA recombinase
MRVAIYARYSSDNQRDASIEDQVRLCKERTEKEGWDLVNIYTDHATSGASLVRPGIQSLMQAAMDGKIDIILAEALDRLSRDLQDIAGLHKRMVFSGVKIFTLSEGEISNLHVGLKGTMNQLFLKDLADKTRRGLRGRVENGKSGGGITYGYDVVKRIDQTGEYARGERAINALQARVVRRIFEDYTRGISPRTIAVTLNKEGVACPSGSTWGASTIYGNRQRGTGILNNELYIGRLIWNRLRYVKDPDTGRRISRLNPESEHVINDVPELRIIDQDLWDAVKKLQGEINHPELPLWKHNRPKNLLAGLMRCGCCGGGFTLMAATRVGCASARNKGTCDNRLTMKMEDIEHAVLSAMQAHLMDDALCEEFCKAYTQRMNQLRSEHNASLGNYRAEAAKLERERQQIIKSISDGVPGTLLKDRAIYVQNRREELDAILASVKEEPVIFHPNMANRYQKEIKNLVASLSDPAAKAQAAMILRTLIEKVVFTPRPGEKTLAVDLFGDLAGILSIATSRGKPAIEAELSKLQPVQQDGEDKNEPFGQSPDSKKPQISAVLASSKAMVAGAGFGHGEHFQNSAEPKVRGALISQDPNTGLQNAMVAGAGFEPATFRL